jgi:hypothetical protein
MTTPVRGSSGPGALIPMARTATSGVSRKAVAMASITPARACSGEPSAVMGTRVL